MALTRENAARDEDVAGKLLTVLVATHLSASSLRVLHCSAEGEKAMRG